MSARAMILAAVLLVGCGDAPATTAPEAPTTVAPDWPRRPLSASGEECFEVDVSDRTEYPGWDPSVRWVPVCDLPGNRAARAAAGEIQRDTRP